MSATLKAVRRRSAMKTSSMLPWLSWWRMKTLRLNTRLCKTGILATKKVVARKEAVQIWKTGSRKRRVSTCTFRFTRVCAEAPRGST